MNKNPNEPDLRTQAINAMKALNAIQFPTCFRLLVSEIVNLKN